MTLATVTAIYALSFIIISKPWFKTEASNFFRLRTSTQPPDFLGTHRKPSNDTVTSTEEFSIFHLLFKVLVGMYSGNRSKPLLFPSLFKKLPKQDEIA